MTETITITTNSDMAQSTLDRIEIEHGHWYSYGRDGRETTRPNEVGLSASMESSGRGFRARFTDSDGDYGWGPLGRTKIEAAMLLLAETVGVDRAEKE